MSTRTLAFGPIPSRRMGRNLGVNNIPPSSAAIPVFLRVGRTAWTEIESQSLSTRRYPGDHDGPPGNHVEPENTSIT